RRLSTRRYCACLADRQRHHRELDGFGRRGPPDRCLLPRGDLHVTALRPRTSRQRCTESHRNRPCLPADRKGGRQRDSPGRASPEISEEAIRFEDLPFSVPAMTSPRLPVVTTPASLRRRGRGVGKPAAHPVSPPSDESDPATPLLIDSREVARLLGLGRT